MASLCKLRVLHILSALGFSQGTNNIITIECEKIEQEQIGGTYLSFEEKRYTLL